MKKRTLMIGGVSVLMALACGGVSDETTEVTVEVPAAEEAAEAAAEAAAGAAEAAEAAGEATEEAVEEAVEAAPTPKAGKVKRGTKATGPRGGRR